METVGNLQMLGVPLNKGGTSFTGAKKRHRPMRKVRATVKLCMLPASYIYLRIQGNICMMQREADTFAVS